MKTLLPLLALLIGLPAASASPALGAQTFPTPTAVDLSHVRLEVHLRSTSGAPVAGIRVTLAPAGPALGGPPAGTPGQVAGTDSGGSSGFTGLGNFIWMVNFSGAYQGKVIQAVDLQGRPPLGTVPAGGGFVVQVEQQEENQDPTPVADIPAARVQVAGFVLVPGGDVWAPTIDLAGPADTPQALPTVAPVQAGSDTGPAPPAGEPAARQLTNPIPAPAANPPAATPADNLPPFALLFWVLPAIAAGVALYAAWRKRRREAEGQVEERVERE